MSTSETRPPAEAEASAEAQERLRRRTGDVPRPIGGYLAIGGAFASLTGGFAAWLIRSGRELPVRPASVDVVGIAVATHKLSRLIAKDRVTSPLRRPFTSFEDNAGPGEVDERARGTGLKRAIGELIVCPYCLSVWIATLLTAGLIVFPRATRWSASVLSAVFASDVLQIVYKKLEDTL